MPLGTVTGATTPVLSQTQQQALSKLHDAAQQFEGVFIDMMLKEMRKTESDETLTGPKSSTEKMFTEMLDNERSTALAKTGSFGIAKILENQLRSAVLANAGREATTPLRKVGLRASGSPL